MVPKFLRDRDSRTPSKTDVHPRRSSKEWNPATFYIIIFLLIGSQAVHLLVLRKDYETYSRRADAKLELLREVIARLQKGENVDVEKILGTGDEAKEREWEEGKLIAFPLFFVLGYSDFEPGSFGCCFNDYTG